MSHSSWECADPNCTPCELELRITRLTKHMREDLEYQSTGWYINLGIKVGYKLALELSVK